MSQYQVNVNPFNHTTVIGKIAEQPTYLTKPDQKYSVFKVNVLAPRNYVNHDKNGTPVRRWDNIKGSCYINDKQMTRYKKTFVKNTWVILRGEYRSVQYRNHGVGPVIHARPFNLEDIETYKIPHTDKMMLMPYDKQKIISSVKGLNWLISHPGLIRQYAKNAYYWLAAHDAFVPTRVQPIKRHNLHK